MGKDMDDQYSDEEAEQRMNDALRRALNTPPKPHEQMKIDQGKSTVKRDHKRKETRPRA